MATNQKGTSGYYLNTFARPTQGSLGNSGPVSRRVLLDGFVTMVRLTPPTTPDLLDVVLLPGHHGGAETTCQVTKTFDEFIKVTK